MGNDSPAAEAAPQLHLPPGMQVPVGVKLHCTTPLPPELVARLERARAGGRYMVAVWEVEPVDRNAPTINLHWSRAGFEYDCLLRALAMFRDAILNQPLPESLAAKPVPATPATPPDSAT